MYTRLLAISQYIVKREQRKQLLVEAQLRAEAEAVQRILSSDFRKSSVQAPTVIEQSSGEPDSKLIVSGDTPTLQGTGTYAIPVQSELVSKISENLTFEMKTPVEQELLKNKVPSTRKKDQEEKRSPKGENTQNKEAKLSCLESRTHSFVALVAKLEVVRVPDFSEDWLSYLAKSMHFGLQNCISKWETSVYFSLQKSEYFAHFFEESKSQTISGDLSREKSQEPKQTGKKFPEFEFYRKFKKKSLEFNRFRRSQSQKSMRDSLIRNRNLDSFQSQWKDSEDVMQSCSQELRLFVHTISTE